MAEAPPKPLKETTFGFDLNVSDDGSLNSLLIGLQEMAGVRQVDLEGDSSSATLKVRVVFADKQVAMKLHRKIMKTIMNAHGILTSRVTSKLTDIFD